MISVLAQERLLGAALGSIFTGVVIFEQRKSIYKSIHHSEPQPIEPIFGRKSRQEFAHAWNKYVDNTFVPVIEYLSSRGWLLVALFYGVYLVINLIVGSKTYN